MHTGNSSAENNKVKDIYGDLRRSFTHQSVSFIIF